MKFRFPDRHHRRGLPLREHLRPGHPRARQGDREGGHGGAGRHQLRRPVAVRAAASPRVGVHPVDRRRGVHAGSRARSGGASNLRTFIEEIRFKNAEIPIYLYGETRTSRHIPNDILRELHGFIHMFEDTPEFVARHIIREAQEPISTRCRRRSSARWCTTRRTARTRGTAPGHSGGVAFLKSPVGQMFHQFFGENMLRADVCNAVDELGPAARPHRARSRPPSAMPRASSAPTTASSSPTAPRRRTRWCGTPTSRRTTSSSSTATATCRSCTRSR